MSPGRRQLGNILQVEGQDGGLEDSALSRLCELEEENQRLKQM